MARLYANENFPLPVVKELRRLGHDVLTTQDTGRAEKAVPDEEVLEYATSQKRAVITLNRSTLSNYIGENPITQVSSSVRSTETSSRKRNVFTTRPRCPNWPVS